MPTKKKKNISKAVSRDDVLALLDQNFLWKGSDHLRIRGQIMDLGDHEIDKLKKLHKILSEVVEYQHELLKHLLAKNPNLEKDLHETLNNSFKRLAAEVTAKEQAQADLLLNFDDV